MRHRKRDNRRARERLIAELEALRGRSAQLEGGQTSRPTAEEELRAVSEFNSSLIQSSPAYFVALDGDLRVVLMNETMLEAVGYAMDEVAGADYVDTFIPKRDRERRLKILRGIVKDKLSTLAEGAVLTKDGAEMFVKWHATPVLRKDGELAFFFGLGIDVTEYRMASEALERERDDAQRVLDVAGVMFVEIAADGRVRRINRKGCELLGASEEEILGKDWFATFLPEGTRDEVRAWFDRLMAGDGEIHSHEENPVVTAAGEERIVEWHNTALRDARGDITGTLSSGINITDRKRAEEIRQLAYSIGSAVHTVRSTGELFATIHHELGKVINSENFFIALYDSAADTITLPYFVDQEDQDDFAAFPAGKTLTAYVLRNNTSLLLTRDEADRWVEAGIVERIGTSSEIWLGVPLRVRDEVIGALVVQSYTNRDEFGDSDREMLEFVSGQIGLAIERKRAEEELRESEARNRAILNAVPDLMFQLTRDGTFTSYDAPADAPLAMPPERFLGKRVDQIFSKDFAQEILTTVERALTSGEIQLLEYTLPMPMPGGEPRDFEGRFVPTGDATVLSVVRDITESKRARTLLGTLNRAALAMERTLKPEEVFAAATEELRKIGIRSVISRMDDEGRTLSLVHMNHDAERLAVVEETIGMSLEDMVIEIDRSRIMRPVIRDRKTTYCEDARQILADLQPELPRDALLNRAEGSVEATKAIHAPLVADDRVIGVLGVLSANLDESDVPAVTAFAHQLAAAWRKATLLEELGKSLEKLERTQDQLLQAQKMEAVGRLAGGVAHDFNNLLTAMKGYAELVLGRSELDEQARADVDQIRKAADQAATLTKQLLAFSRRQPLEPQAINLNEVVVESDGMLRRLIGEDIELHSVLSSGDVTVKGDPGQVEQVIINLVVNARDAMPDGGRLTIETGAVTLDEVACRNVHDARPGDFVCLAIQDSGTGIPREIMDRIFEPFFSTKGPGKGTGLGLAVVYGVIRQHEGWINVYSEPGQGTSFKVYLPACSSDEAHTRCREVPRAQPRGDGQRILLVEDEEAVRSFAARALRESGYVVSDAASADEAMEIFEKESGDFDLIFSDVVLPGQSGIRLVDRLLALKPDLEVLLSSGYTDQKSQWPVIREKGFRFLQKPYSLPDLLGTIREIVRPD